MKLPAELKPQDVVAVIDTREQTPLDLSPLQIVSGSLQTGDYGLLHLPFSVALERKSLGDLLSCVGSERPRFERELDRLRAYPCRCLLIESSWSEIERGEWRSKLTPAQVIGSLLAWQESGIPLLLTDNHQRAGQFAARILFTVARRRYRELRGLLSTVEPTEQPEEAAA